RVPLSIVAVLQLFGEQRGMVAALLFPNRVKLSEQHFAVGVLPPNTIVGCRNIAGLGRVSSEITAKRLAMSRDSLPQVGYFFKHLRRFFFRRPISLAIREKTAALIEMDQHTA